MRTTSQPMLSCLDEDRRAITRAGGWNGIDYLEVSNDQLHLTLYFLGRAPQGLAPANIVITGGRRVTGIRALQVQVSVSADPRFDDHLKVTVDRAGDFTDYQICLRRLDERGEPTDEPLEGFDPRYACLDFSFKSGCPTGLDCEPVKPCPPPARTEPEIDYLARDYGALRTLILDRLSVLIPDWNERHVPDLGITLVELLAYAGDHLSYMQDAVATEAYLLTARQRISVRRHARLVDYWMHEGNNARAWVCLSTDTELDLDLEGVCLVAADLAPNPAPMTRDELDELAESARQIFEPVVVAHSSFRVQPAHNVLRIHTWGDGECCLPAGATSATLIDTWRDPGDPPTDLYTQEPAKKQAAGHYQAPTTYPLPHDDCYDEPAVERPRSLDLRPGDVIVFEEVIGPRTGNPADANPAHRHAVCITSVKPAVDVVCDQPILDITWSIEDALPFPLCISTQGPAPDCQPLCDVSVACGNVILVDHGLTCEEPIGKVPTEASEPFCGDECCPPELVLTPGRYRPRLAKPSVTSCESLETFCPAATAILQEPRQALHHVELREIAPDGSTAQWTIVRDLLRSSRDDRHFVTEVDNQGRATVRFGDGESGTVPAAGSEFVATYRVGNGRAGNVGAETINRIVYKAGTQSGVDLRVRNPMAATGGIEPEPVDQVKLFAPHAFHRVLARAVTAADYSEIVERDFPEVQQAAASLVFTGSHTEVVVAVDQRGISIAEPRLLAEVGLHLERFRRIGHDVMVVAAVHVPIDLGIVVCVEPGYLQGHVEVAVRSVLSNRRRADGTRGFFHPDQLSFGVGVFVSRIVAAVQALDGVESVHVTRLERLFEGDQRELEQGVLPTGPSEIARLDNDPSFPEGGILSIEMRGGR